MSVGGLSLTLKASTLSSAARSLSIFIKTSAASVHQSDSCISAKLSYLTESWTKTLLGICWKQCGSSPGWSCPWMSYETKNCKNPPKIYLWHHFPRSIYFSWWIRWGSGVIVRRKFTPGLIGMRKHDMTSKKTNTKTMTMAMTITSGVIERRKPTPD